MTFRDFIQHLLKKKTYFKKTILKTLHKKVSSLNDETPKQKTKKQFF